MPEHADVSDFLQVFQLDGIKRLGSLAKSAEFWNPESFPKPSESGVIRLSDVQSTETDWLWYPYIPRGKITLLTADPGLGKTFFALYLTACVSTGRPFWGEEKPYRQPETAVYQTAEDGISDTIKPRLEPMTPNFANILMIDETSEGLSLSDERIEQIMRTYRRSQTYPRASVEACGKLQHGGRAHHAQLENLAEQGALPLIGNN